MSYPGNQLNQRMQQTYRYLPKGSLLKRPGLSSSLRQKDFSGLF